jgi:hypothetical protein
VNAQSRLWTPDSSRLLPRCSNWQARSLLASTFRRLVALAESNSDSSLEPELVGVATRPPRIRSTSGGSLWIWGEFRQLNCALLVRCGSTGVAGGADGSESVIPSISIQDSDSR